MIGSGQPIDLPLAIFKRMLKALQEAKNASLPYGILVARILFSHGIVAEPFDDLLHGKGRITYRTLEMSSSHVLSDDSEDEEDETAA